MIHDLHVTAETRFPGVNSAARFTIMGVVNVTPDSFSDGGSFLDPVAAVEYALQLASDGADILDIGGESSRPGADEVPEDEELRRVLPVIEGIRKHSRVPISVDTTKSVVAEHALTAGADVINDISALRFDERMAGVIAAHDAGVVLMHMLGTPRTMQDQPRYGDVISDLLSFFRERVDHCIRSGIRRTAVDPGIGFGKSLEHNLALLHGLRAFRMLGCPVLIGTSRKSFLGRLTDRPVEGRLAGTIASNVLAWMNGASLFRVHDVAAVRDALTVAQAIAVDGGR